jgi:hypothetical protein
MWEGTETALQKQIDVQDQKGKARGIIVKEIM